MTAAIIETKRIDGKPAHRLVGTPDGAWLTHQSEIHAMLSLVQSELGVKQCAVLDAIQLDRSALSRCRHGVRSVQESWILRLQDYSGIPAAELRRAGCTQPDVQPHANARRAA